MKDFFGKCDQIRRKLQNLVIFTEISLLENFIFCAVRKFHLEQFNQYYHGFFSIINFMGVVIWLQSCKKIQQQKNTILNPAL